MSEFQINDGILYRECKELAEEIFREAMESNPDSSPEDLRDDMFERAHETADGHQWVIYTHKALMICAHCDTTKGEEFLEDVGMPEEPSLSSLVTLIVYGEIRGRIEEELQELIDSHEEPEEEEEEEE